MAKSFFGSLIVIFFAASAFANIEISCIAESCLTEGWQAYDWRTGDGTLTECVDQDCAFLGWQIKFQGRQVSSVHCKQNGCFVDGWKVLDSIGRTMADVSCHGSSTGTNCLQYGWNTMEPGRGSYQTKCIKGDCENLGWDTVVPGFLPQSTRCKEGGCFQAGWIIYQ